MQVPKWPTRNQVLNYLVQDNLAVISPAKAKSLQIYAATRIRIITNSSRKQANSLITQQNAIPCKYMQKHGYELSQIHPANKQIHWSHNKPPSRVFTRSFAYITAFTQPTHYMHTLYRCTNRCTVTVALAYWQLQRPRKRRPNVLNIWLLLVKSNHFTWFKPGSRTSPQLLRVPFSQTWKNDTNAPSMNDIMIFTQVSVISRSPSWLNHLWNAFRYQNYGTLTWLP